jgi:hypothetical protein
MITVGYSSQVEQVIVFLGGVCLMSSIVNMFYGLRIDNLPG